MNGSTLRGVVRVVAQPVGVEDGDILACPISTWAPVDLEETVEVYGDVILVGAHVQRGVPGCNEGLPVDQGQLSRFLTKGSMEEQKQPGTGEGNRYDMVGGGCPAHWHHRHPWVQEEQLSIILREGQRCRKDKKQKL